jgi:hypothetical protein
MSVLALVRTIYHNLTLRRSTASLGPWRSEAARRAYTWATQRGAIEAAQQLILSTKLFMASMAPTISRPTSKAT